MREAYDTFKAKSVQRILDSEILTLFDRYPEARNKFGLQLLYRNFHMGPNEILVKVERTATPWNTKQLGGADQATVRQGRVVPDCFVLSPGFQANTIKAEPHRFRYMLNSDEPIASPTEKENQAFLRGLLDILQKHGLTDVLGLVALSPELKPRKGNAEQPKWMWEKTFGRANILFPITKKTNDLIGVLFVFIPAHAGAGVSAHCFSPCLCTAPGWDGFDE
ncbi:hypothetical protein SLS53_006634 [Cytospora paraplurivora]|uniref:Uncharacterized protein n=1 Tax=Cytospora paraplurivora TaxID=2898453 RepID=A0AAN9TVJ9_9PEZI